MTTEELTEANKKLRERRLKDIQFIGYDKFTCDNCTDKNTCRSRFDSYNTNDECLEEK